EKMDEPQTLEEINANKFKIRPNDELYNIMISSEKIEFDSANRTFKYKERNDKSTVPRGMQYKELNDCIDLSNAIAGKIMVIRLVKDSTPQFVKMFHSVKVPDETDLKKSLEDAGLQSMAVFENRGIIE
ncbi:13358_t:CDS:2, partial [Entrophospora sp. SA101]